MNKLLCISLINLAAFGCRSSYDEAKSRPELRSSAEMQGNFPIVEAPEAPQVPSSNLPRSVPSPDMITTQHNATAEELRKYNCKGTALITDSGVDDNRDSKLSDEEIQETRIDCTEVVPGS